MASDRTWPAAAPRPATALDLWSAWMAGRVSGSAAESGMAVRSTASVGVGGHGMLPVGGQKPAR